MQFAENKKYFSAIKSPHSHRIPGIVIYRHNDEEGKCLLIQIILNLQDQTDALTKEIHDLNDKMQLMLEQLVLAKKNRFGRYSEKMEDMDQIAFKEVDGTIVFFNEAFTLCHQQQMDIIESAKKLWQTIMRNAILYIRK